MNSIIRSIEYKWGRREKDDRKDRRFLNNVWILGARLDLVIVKWKYSNEYAPKSKYPHIPNKFLYKSKYLFNPEIIVIGKNEKQVRDSESSEL